MRLSRHEVKARVAGAMARTEIDETFVNTTDRELEGVWRFPLPQGARLERLALEVDGKLVEGEFVDARRAAGIWRGVIQQATPNAPRPAEEIVWVPGPWRDPALLEWQRGGRAELKIFPIPRKGTRRVVLAYTQHVAPEGGVRRYVYPLAARAGVTPIDEVSFDIRVVGADPTAGVHARGYELAAGTASAESGDPSVPTSLSMARTAFTPSGDLVVEYATRDRAAEASAVAFAAPGSQDDAFVAIALRPRLPSRIADRSRDQVLVVDTGRAMFGERLRRASRMAVELAQQMDRRDRLTVLACDLECRAMPGGWHTPGAACAHDVDAFLAGATADGASDFAGAVQASADVAGRADDHDLRVVLLSDGVATAGVRGLSRIGAEVTAHLSDPRAQVVAVPIGSDADVDTLSEIARGGGGAVLPYGAGQSLEAAALDVLSATYGATLRDVELTLPEGLHDVAPGADRALARGGRDHHRRTHEGRSRRGGPRAAGQARRRGLRGALAPRRASLGRRGQRLGGAHVGRRSGLRRRARRRRERQGRGGRAFPPLPGAEPPHVAAGARERGDVPRLRRRARRIGVRVDGRDGVAAAPRSRRRRTRRTGKRTSRGVEGQGGVGAVGGSSLGALSGLGNPSAAAAPKKLSRAEEPVPPGAAPLDVAATPFAERPSGSGGGFAQAPPAATRAPPAPPVPLAPLARNGPSTRAGRWMRRVWFRGAAVSADERSPVDAGRLEAARVALEGSPDLRQRHSDLAKLLVRAGNVRELESVTERWSARDPLDPDLLTARAAARAWRGDREGALRILSGMLASPATSSATQADIASTLARAEERALRPAVACALRTAAAEASPTT